MLNVLTLDGTLTILTDNEWYAKMLLKNVDIIRDSQIAFLSEPKVQSERDIQKIAAYTRAYQVQNVVLRMFLPFVF